jgi:hypothetical protein
MLSRRILVPGLEITQYERVMMRQVSAQQTDMEKHDSIGYATMPHET